MSAETKEAPDLKNAYTDSPELFSNVFLAGFQIIFWLVFHPLAMENYFKRAEPKISDNISLFGVIRDRGKNRFEKAVVVNLYLVIPIIFFLVWSLLLWLLFKHTMLIDPFLSLQEAFQDPRFGELIGTFRGEWMNSPGELFFQGAIFFLITYYVASLIIHYLFEFRLGLVVIFFIALPSHIFFLLATIKFFSWENYSHILIMLGVINCLFFGMAFRVSANLMKSVVVKPEIYSQKLGVLIALTFGLLCILGFTFYRVKWESGVILPIWMTRENILSSIGLTIDTIWFVNIASLQGLLLFHFWKNRGKDKRQNYEGNYLFKLIILKPNSFKSLIFMIVLQGVFVIASLIKIPGFNTEFPTYIGLLPMMLSLFIIESSEGSFRALNNIANRNLKIIPISIIIIFILQIFGQIAASFSTIHLYYSQVMWSNPYGSFVFSFILWSVFSVTFFLFRRLTIWRSGWVLGFIAGGMFLLFESSYVLGFLEIPELENYPFFIFIKQIWDNFNLILSRSLSIPNFDYSIPLISMGIGGAIVIGFSYPYWIQLINYLPYQIWAWLLYLRDINQKFISPVKLRYHPVFIDQFQGLQFFGLYRHLIQFSTSNPKEGERALDYLAISRQRKVVQKVLIELDALTLEKSTNLEAIAQVQSNLKIMELSGQANALLRSFKRISEETKTALNYGTVYHQRLALGKVEESLNGLLREMQRSNERYEKRFYPIAQKWQQIIHQHVEKIQEETDTDELINPYVIFIPLRPGGEMDTFVGRGDVSVRIERLIMSRQSPPLLLYGQRRMGKTSLLKNLGRLLPQSVVPLYIDIQGPIENASNHASFFQKIAEEMSKSARDNRGLTFPKLDEQKLATDPIIQFDQWLDQVESVADTQHGNAILLTLDEFEALDNAFQKGSLEENAVLGYLRHLIQHRDRFKILLSGSHAIQEFDRWASYLINTQVIHISYLKESEAMQLIERPYASFPLRYEPKASARVFSLTRGHPGLLQLFCSEMVDYKNEQEPSERRFATLDDIEAVVPIVLKSGREFFATLEHDQVDQAGRALLNFIAAQGEGVAVSEDRLQQTLPDPDDLAQTLKLLERRELIEKVDGGYRFQVELIRRWFAWEGR
ncbi:MAG: AAA family ATPase [Anaerolineales bacterium]|nr:AAA family ATPase [Anaerolineales bacterium]